MTGRILSEASLPLHPADFSCLFHRKGKEIISEFMLKELVEMLNCWHGTTSQGLLLTCVAENTFRGCYI
jgi:hypothetical protein